MQRPRPFPAAVSPEAAKSMKSVKVGPFSCYCLMKPNSGETAPLGEEDCFDYDEATPYAVLADDVDGARGNSSHNDLPAWMKGELVPGPVPPLTPLGGGGWHLEEYFEDEMRKVRDEALHLFRSETQEGDVSKFILDFLTPFTLFNYIRPHAPVHLKNALLRRAEREKQLTCQVGGIELVGSMRVLGFDGQGMSIVASEPRTMKQSVAQYLDQVEYVSLTALDLNRPNPKCTSGFIQFMDFGGGFNLTHFLDPRPCIALAQVWESEFRRRTKAVILVEMPKTFQAPLNLFLQLAKHSIRNKMIFCANPEEAIDALKKFHCDEETLAKFRNYMNERRRLQASPTWHPIIDIPFFRERLASLRLNQDTAFLSLDAHQRFRETIQEFRLQNWGPPMRPKPDSSSSSSRAPASTNVVSLAHVEGASPSISAMADTNKSHDMNMEQRRVGNVEVALNPNATEPSSSHIEGSRLPMPALQIDVEPQKVQPEMLRCTSSDLTPCGGTMRGPDQAKVLFTSDSAEIARKQKLPSTAEKALVTRESKGCTAGITRMLQRVGCCGGISGKPRAE